MFVEKFSSIIASLTELTKDGSPNELPWTEEHEEAFDRLKPKLASTPILRLPDLSKPFILQNDTSDVGLGAVLKQKYEGVNHPVAYASRKLLARESGYNDSMLYIINSNESYDHH